MKLNLYQWNIEINCRKVASLMKTFGVLKVNRIKWKFEGKEITSYKLQFYVIEKIFK